MDEDLLWEHINSDDLYLHPDPLLPQAIAPGSVGVSIKRTGERTDLLRSLSLHSKCFDSEARFALRQEIESAHGLWNWIYASDLYPLLELASPGSAPAQLPEYERGRGEYCIFVSAVLPVTKELGADIEFFLPTIDSRTILQEQDAGVMLYCLYEKMAPASFVSFMRKHTINQDLPLPERIAFCSNC